MSKTGTFIDVDLAAEGEATYLVPASNRLWLPKVVLRGSDVFVNPLDAVVAIRFDESSGSDVWAIKDGYRNTESGPFRKVLVTVVHKGVGAKLCLMTGINVMGGYANADGLSPVIGGGVGENPVLANKTDHLAPA